MNNFGMNPMGVNPMLMNNMGMNPMLMNNNMGMNNMGNYNQSNLNDENALRIKNIIQPYENKIRELEETIRQKDYEIAILKDKINNNGFNIQSQNLMNMNQMMLNMNQMNMIIEKLQKGKEISVYFRNVKYNCFEDDMTYKLIEKLFGGSNWYLITYTINGKKINPFICIKENNIEDGDIIDCNNVFNLYFTLQNKMITIDGNYPIKKAIKYYLLRIGKENCYEQFNFIWNGKRININDKRPIKDIVLFNSNPSIVVTSIHDL